MHQLVQRVQRDTIPDVAVTRCKHLSRHVFRLHGRIDCSLDWPVTSWATQATRLIADQLPTGRHTADQRRRYCELLPHTERLLEHAEQHNVPALDSAHLAERLATYHANAGDYRAAAALHSQVVDTYRSLFGDHHHETAR